MNQSGSTHNPKLQKASNLNKSATPKSLQKKSKKSIGRESLPNEDNNLDEELMKSKI